MGYEKHDNEKTFEEMEKEVFDIMSKNIQEAVDEEIVNNLIEQIKQQKDGTI